MPRGMRDTVRKIRDGTSRAMIRAVRYCKSCGRGLLRDALAT